MAPEPESDRLVREQNSALAASLRRAEEMLSVERDSAERLHRVATQLINVQGIEALYEEILDATIAILHADFAGIQMFYPERGPGGSLRLLGHRGFSPEAVKRWEWVDSTMRTACAEALRTGRRIAVPDVRTCDFMAGSEELQGYLGAGILAAHSLPLVSRSGSLLGMVCNHWVEPHELSMSEVRAMDVLARLAADLIERSRAEQKLRESEERLRFAQEAANIGTFDWNIETGVSTWTPTLERMYGLRPGGFPGAHAAWESLIHPEDRALAVQRVSESLQTTTPVEAEWRVVWPDGSVHWLAGRWRVFRNAMGKPLRMMGVNIDVTDRKQMEEALRRSEERFRLGTKATNDAIWDIDLKTGSVHWNETYSALYGRPDSGDSMQWWIDRVHPDDRERTVVDFQAAIASGASSWSGEYRFRRLDGEWAHVYDRAYIARDDHGNAWRVIGAMQDITERKQVEARIQEREERFRRMADAAPVMIWVSGPDKLCTFFNKGWLEFTGRTTDQELGNGWAAGVHPNDLDQCFATYSSAFDARRNFQMEYRLRRADGEYRWVFDTGIPLFTADSAFEGYIGSCTDITELKRSQQENLHRQKLESIGALAAGIAHDFNNLLGGILAETELMEQGIPTQLHGAEELTRIKRLASRGSEIVRELMVYAGRETTEFEPVDLSMLVEEMLELLKISVSKRVTLRTNLGQNLPLVRGQTPQIRQLVMNLITNASEAIGDREGVITLATSLVKEVDDASGNGAGQLPTGDYVRLEVSDTGSGITEEEMTRIFDPFYTTKFPGRGLGLAVVQGVVRAHNGAIRVESVPGQGTMFRIFLPCTEESVIQKRTTGVPASVERRSAGTPTVLLVEDEHSLRQAVAKMLRKRGFTVVEAADGSAAIDSLHDGTQGIDVVLLDLTIPGADSREVVQEAQRVRPDARIVITSAYSQDAASHLSVAPQVTGYIRKPFLIDDLTNLLLRTTSA